jgi:hypothetical protein
MDKQNTKQEQGEPVKLVAYNCTCGRTMKFESKHGIVAPQPAQKPLTDEQISNLWCKVSNTDFVTVDTHVFARAIEAAHGIKENT